MCARVGVCVCVWHALFCQIVSHSDLTRGSCSFKNNIMASAAPCCVVDDGDVASQLLQ